MEVQRLEQVEIGLAHGRLTAQQHAAGGSLPHDAVPVQIDRLVDVLLNFTVEVRVDGREVPLSRSSADNCSEAMPGPSDTVLVDVPLTSIPIAQPPAPNSPTPTTTATIARLDVPADADTASRPGRGQRGLNQDPAAAHRHATRSPLGRERRAQRKRSANDSCWRRYLRQVLLCFSSPLLDSQHESCASCRNGAQLDTGRRSLPRYPRRGPGKADLQRYGNCASIAYLATQAFRPRLGSLIYERADGAIRAFLNTWPDQALELGSSAHLRARHRAQSPRLPRGRAGRCGLRAGPGRCVRPDLDTSRPATSAPTRTTRAHSGSSRRHRRLPSMRSLAIASYPPAPARRSPTASTC